MTVSSADAPGPGSTVADDLGAAPRVDPLDRAAVLDAVTRGLLGEPGEPLQLGRYVILRPLGRGGMGMVYAAYDEDLDRKVAVKLLRREPTGADESEDADGRSRLRAEARALARLCHPNVVTVHEVGEHHGRVFVAMEYVRGRTLAQWVQQDDPGWERIVEAMLAAGRGLAAAHRVGVVHRDFKPDNVMVASDGTIKVVDFGLARSSQDERPAHAAPTPARDAIRIDTPLTRTGALLGSPAYMSPEQFVASRVDARSDQFSFCVSLYELLYDRRPFVGATVEELTASMRGDEPAEPPPTTAVSPRIHRTLCRGLRTDPRARFETLEELLSELEPAPSVPSRAGWWGLGAVASVCAAVLALGDHRDPSAVTCASAAAASETVWNDARAQRVRRALRQARDRVDAGRVVDGLDAYARSWRRARIDACEATHVRAEQSARRLDLRMLCLDRYFAGFDALAETLADADASVARRALVAVNELPPLQRCADPEFLEAEVRPPADPETATAVEALFERLATLDAPRR